MDGSSCVVKFDQLIRYFLISLNKLRKKETYKNRGIKEDQNKEYDRIEESLKKGIDWKRGLERGLERGLKRILN